MAKYDAIVVFGTRYALKALVQAENQKKSRFFENYLFLFIYSSL